MATKVTILRNNLFGHRSAKIGYEEVFKKAKVTPNELHDLTDIAMKIVNRLLVARGLEDHIVNTLPVNDAKRMMEALSQVVLE